MSPKNSDKTESLATNAAEAVYHTTKDYRIVAFYPRHRQHGALLSLLHQYYDDLMYYYTFNEADSDLKSFIWNLSHDPMFPIGFGNSTRFALQTSYSPEDWGIGLAEDLATLHDEHIILLLEGFDVLPKDDSNQKEFFVGLAENLPNNIQIFVSGRELRRKPWVDLADSNLAIFLGDDDADGGNLFEEPALRGHLEVYALSGGSRVLVDGRFVTAWEGSLPRNLFYYFLDTARVTRSEVFEAFWPNLGIKEATNVFHVTKRKISEKTGYDITIYKDGFYTPNPQVERLYDVAIFEENFNLGMESSNDDEMEQYLSKAVEVYRGQFLKEVDMEWARQRRQNLRDMYTQALINLAQIYNNQGKDMLALNYYIRAIGEKPDREDVHRAVMQIYSDQGEIEAIKSQYSFLENILKESLDIEPSQETRELYETLLP